MQADAAVALLQGARTLTARAALLMPAGEARLRTQLASAALADAIEQRAGDLESERILGHLEVLADALETPGQEAA